MTITTKRFYWMPTKHLTGVAFSLLTFALLAACTGPSQLGRYEASAYRTVERPVAGCAAGERQFECDRRAILAMLGDYEVQFRFEETVLLKAGYERREPKRSMGFEHVVLVEDTGRRISLQHILVTRGGMVTKHWRQDWLYEAPRHWVYAGDQRFEQQERDAKQIPGTWTQLVYEVNDGPRYAGSGMWNHKYGVSTWTSGRSWRPLPRREYTTRNDYHLINAENRHTIAPQGWAHEQDNTKVIRAEDGSNQLLVREFGFNEYRRIEGYDFTPAIAYWEATSEFWKVVRARWAAALDAGKPTVLSFATGDESFNTKLLELADEYRKNPDLDLYRNRIENAFQTSVKPGALSRSGDN